MIFEILLTSCLAWDPTDCGTGRIPVEGDLAACRTRARVIAANVPRSAALQSYPCVEAGQFPEFGFSEVAPGVFVHKGHHAPGPDAENRGNISNITFIVGDASVAVIDAGGHPWIGDAVLRAIRRETALPVSTLILTGIDPAHALGLGPLLEDGGSVLGPASTPTDLASAWLDAMQAAGVEDISAANVVLPDDRVDAARTLSLGNRELQIVPQDASGSQGRLSVLDVTTGTLILGDLLHAGMLPAVTGPVAGWRDTLAAMAALPAKRAVPGHGPAAMPWPESAAPLQQYLSVLAAGEPPTEAMRRAWLMFDARHDANTAAAASGN